MASNGGASARIVVGYDGSASARVAVGWAAGEAARRDLPLTVVYAVDYAGLVGGPVRTLPWPGVATDEARRTPERGAELARTHDAATVVTADDVDVVSLLAQHHLGDPLVHEVVLSYQDTTNARDCARRLRCRCISPRRWPASCRCSGGSR